MSPATPEHGAEPKLLVPALEPLYAWVRELSWPVIRVTAGGVLLAHGIAKLMGAGIAAFAAASMARRGIQPALPAAYAVYFLENVGAVAIILGLFTRFFAAAIALEFVVITIVAAGPNGFGWTNPGGGWEYPFLWGMIFLAIALRGGGPYSVDRLIGREL